MQNQNIYYLEKAITLSQECIKSNTAYSVGAIIVTKGGNIYTGYSRETHPDNHAEEEAIIKALNQKEDLRFATLYTSMEPCSKRNSKLKPCTTFIIEKQFSKVVFATSEPTNFQQCKGEELLKQAGIEVLKIASLAKKALSINEHIIGNTQ